MQILSVYVGLDYHSDSIQVCIMASDGSTLSNRRVKSDVGCVLEEVQRCREACRANRHEPVELIVKAVAIEACTGSAEFATRLTEATGWNVRLGHAGAIRQFKHVRDKTDHGDAWHIANLLLTGYLPRVWLADEQTRQLRHLVRHRQALMADAKDIKLRIRSLLKEDNVAENCERGSWTKAWLAWLATVELPEHSRWIVNQDLKLLENLQASIQEVDEQMASATATDPLVQKLLEQESVGLVTALLLRAVIGRIDRFKNGKQLARYCGLTPCNASSGKRQADAGLLRAGNDDLRAALIQLAKRLPRQAPRWREFRERLGKRKPANVVSAAIANRWIRRLYHELKPLNVPPTQAQAA